MPQDVQQRIDRIVEYYLCDEGADAAITDEFLDWFSDGGHLVQKYRALETMFDRQVAVDAHPSRETRREFERLSRRLGLERPRPVRGLGRFAVRIAAAIVPLAVAGALLWCYCEGNSGHPEPQTQIAQPLACNTVVLTAPDNELLIHQCLPDSSNISMNEGSSLHYTSDFKQSRVVTLSGESYFKVRQRQGEPFVVQTKNMKITVRGTVFNVDSYPDSLRDVVSLYQGDLHVEVDSQAFDLTQGERLIYDRVRDHVIIRSIAGKEKPCWMQRVLTFNRMPAAEIVRELAESYRVQIVCHDPALLDETLTVHYEADTPLHEVLSCISTMSSRADYRVEKRVLIVTGKPDNRTHDS